MAEVVETFAIPLDTVLAEHFPQNDMVEDPVIVRAMDRGFKAVDDTFGEENSNWPVSPQEISVVFARALQNDGHVLDAARKAIRQNHPRLARFTEKDKRYLLHAVGDILVEQLDRVIRGRETVSLYYDYVSSGLERAEVRKVKAFQADLSQKATSPIHEAPRT